MDASALRTSGHDNANIARETERTGTGSSAAVTTGSSVGMGVNRRRLLHRDVVVAPADVQSLLRTFGETLNVRSGKTGLVPVTPDSAGTRFLGDRQVVTAGEAEGIY